MAKANTRLAGHTLPDDGWIYDNGTYWAGQGSAKCSCGEPSPILPTAPDRRRWHRDHKQQARTDAARIAKED